LIGVSSPLERVRQGRILQVPDDAIERVEIAGASPLDQRRDVGASMHVRKTREWPVRFARPSGAPGELSRPRTRSVGPPMRRTGPSKCKAEAVAIRGRGVHSTPARAMSREAL